MEYKGTKELKDEANALILSNVTDRAGYEAALRLYRDTLDRAKQLSDSAKTLKMQSERIGELAAKYAEKHPTALDEPLVETRSGIRSGSVTLDGVPFRLTLSKGDVCRISGDKLTKEFLEALPKEWTKAKVELNNAAVKGESAARLAKYDLHRPDKSVWKVGSKEADAEAEGCDA